MQSLDLHSVSTVKSLDLHRVSTVKRKDLCRMGVDIFHVFVLESAYFGPNLVDLISLHFYDVIVLSHE